MLSSSIIAQIAWMAILLANSASSETSNLSGTTDQTKLRPSFVLKQECEAQKNEPWSSFPSRTASICVGKRTEWIWSIDAAEIRGRRLYISLDLSPVDRRVLQLELLITSFAKGTVAAHVGTINLIADGKLELSSYIPAETDAIYVSMASSDAPARLAVRGVAAWTSPLVSEVGAMCVDCRTHFDQTFKRIEENFVFASRVSLADIRRKSLLTATGSKTKEELTATLKEAARLLGDPHTRYFSSQEFSILKAQMAGAVRQSDSARADISVQTAKQAAPSLVSSRLFQGNVGYIRILGFAGTDLELRKKYAIQIRDSLDELARSGATRWVVDLREHEGGSTEPLIAALRPLIGTGAIGFSVKGSGQKIPWLYGDANSTGNTENYFGNRPNTFDGSAMAVAVLLGPRTASSAEALAVTFIGRPKSKSFGTRTAGFTTSVFDLPFSDGSVMAVTNGVYADRTGKAIQGQIIPDVEVTSEGAPTAQRKDMVLNVALDWIGEN